MNRVMREKINAFHNVAPRGSGKTFYDIPATYVIPVVKPCRFLYEGLRFIENTDLIFGEFEIYRQFVIFNTSMKRMIQLAPVLNWFEKYGYLGTPQLKQK